MRVLYVTGATFAKANAAALRNVGLASALAYAGHDVVIATPDDPTVAADSAWTVATPPGVSVVSVGVPQRRRGKIDSIIGVSAETLRNKIDEWKPDAVILYQSFLPLIVWLRREARRRGIPVILDVTEWYDGASLPFGRLGPHNALNQISMRFVVPRMPAVITISSGLAEHCGRRGSRTIVVPPLFDLSNRPQPRGKKFGGPRERLTIAVTGSAITPGQKDRLALLSIGRAAQAIDPTGARLLVKVAGPSPAAVAELFGGDPPAAFEVLGALPWSDSLDLVSGSDFTLVLRTPGNRRVTLGFPSKVPESLLLGTPILGSVIGDLGRYLVDGRNAALVETADERGLERTLRDQVDHPSRWDRKQIRDDALASFDPREHSSRLTEFISDLVGHR